MPPMPQSLAGTRPGARCLTAAAAVVLLGSSCASEADLDAQYERGIKAARASDWKPAMDDLEGYAAKACHNIPPGPDWEVSLHAKHRWAQCREAYIALGRGY